MAGKKRAAPVEKKQIALGGETDEDDVLPDGPIVSKFLYTELLSKKNSLHLIQIIFQLNITRHLPKPR